MLILIDNGHGLTTPGKRSPDGLFREAFYTREIARRVVADLLDRGYNAELLVSEDEDTPLFERVRRVNARCLLYGKSKIILVSIHVNAASDGTKWMNASGWSCYTSRGNTLSDKLSECLYEAAVKYFHGKKIRTESSDGDSDWEENFYLLCKTWCPVVITENFFQDCITDVQYLQSRTGKQAIVDTHVEGIIEFLESF